LPHLFGGLKAAMSFSIVGAIVGEYVGGDRGLGYVILVAQGSFDTPRAFAAILILSVIATILFYLVVFAESRALPWHVSQRIKAS
jgi:NitT/TauT family transport system permease protein